MLFQPGKIFATPNALALFSNSNMFPIDLLIRHLSGDFGTICDEDKASNMEAIRDGGRILSAYKVGSEKVYVITEWDRSYTTILLASEY
ncbi:hypothetical protein [Silvimonas iriomotensis]|uniref:Uncharacterized protein n=1 Tax=Silvimonas iriomotensis TaxID=449662 RepID=A0ABQ2P4P7_9NEIS|nr:hypothetical protein [Silvimonas iriomotensis]GGP17766.1 hypothetical protein GCM10010970_01440 [Silvimonas iriomotensis]